LARKSKTLEAWKNLTLGDLSSKELTGKKSQPLRNLRVNRFSQKHKKRGKDDPVGASGGNGRVRGA